MNDDGREENNNPGGTNKMSKIWGLSSGLDEYADWYDWNQ